MSLRLLVFLTKFCFLHFHQWRKYPPKYPHCFLTLYNCVTFKHCCPTLQQGNAWPVSPAMCWSPWHCIQSHLNLILQSWFCSHAQLQLLPAVRDSLQMKTKGWNSPAGYLNDLTGWPGCNTVPGYPRREVIWLGLGSSGTMAHRMMPMFGVDLQSYWPTEVSKKPINIIKTSYAKCQKALCYFSKIHIKGWVFSYIKILYFTSGV